MTKETLIGIQLLILILQIVCAPLFSGITHTVFNLICSFLIIGIFIKNIRS